MDSKDVAPTPHSVHGDLNDDEWVFVDEDAVEEILRILQRMRELLRLVLGRDEYDLESIEKCFGETP